MKESPLKPQDWGDGHYVHQCKCGVLFKGNKHRRICKLCHAANGGIAHMTANYPDGTTITVEAKEATK